MRIISLITAIAVVAILYVLVFERDVLQDFSKGKKIEELILEIENITNLGYGIARDNGWVIQIAFVLPGEKVRVKIFRNHKNYSEADCSRRIQSSEVPTKSRCASTDTSFDRRFTSN